LALTFLVQVVSGWSDPSTKSKVCPILITPKRPNNINDTY
jgi:hypothetical protein